MEQELPTSEVYSVPAHISESAHVKDMETYKKMYDESINDPEGFWGKMANEYISWFRPFTDVKFGDFQNGNVSWFLNGQLNASYQCLDRHLKERGDKVAILWEGDDPKDVRHVTYKELHRDVCKLANALKAYGVRKGDNVAIYMPMVPEAAVAMLACARIGAPHSMVFAGFSAEALRDRILDANAKVLITADEGLRGGRVVHLKQTADEALVACPSVQHVFLYKRTGNSHVAFHAPRDVWMHEAMAQQKPYCPCETMDSEDVLFLLYTSGSTGKPKGVQHTTGGYMLYATITSKYVFDIHPDSVYACVADVGWITGHTYIVYGPLSLGATTMMFESVPTYPNPSRYWEMVDKHKITIFYTSPTAIRALMKFGDEPVKKYKLDSLRVLGTVGEPINPSAWKWFHEVVGRGKCAIVDTYWQTETGGIIFSALPGATPLKPGSTTFPFFGVKPVLVDEEKKEIIEGNNVKGLLCIASTWPSIARTIFNDHDRYFNTYLKSYPGLYVTGDGCHRDSDGYYWIIGRVDDVINVSGHRLGTAEIESALVSHDACSEAAVIGVPHDVKGQGIFCYCIFREGYSANEDTLIELKMEVRKHIGPFATPDYVVVVPGLPKTRSGKIMRRLLRKIATGYFEPSDLGDISTLAEPQVVEEIIAAVKAAIPGLKRPE